MAEAIPVQVIPSARRLIHSLRDVGYDFNHAVADLIDNSIEAGATKVAIDMRFDGRDSWLRIADNGSGMNSAQITEAMRFGTERDYGLDELGKFGLGLKMASFSQCRSFSVSSRADRDVCRMEVRKWDLDHVEKCNRWEILDIPARQRPVELTEPLQRETGTVVLWQQLDRVLAHTSPWGETARAGFLQMAELLDAHLAMVFHRFLKGEARRKKPLSITINGTSVRPWDPFARAQKATKEFDKREITVYTENGRGMVRYTAYVLPPQSQFSSPREFEYYSGPAKWNYQQGFYIYRADRLIQSGGWSRMRTADEHTKLARAALDFMPDLDTSFTLDVGKGKVKLPVDLRRQLDPLIEKLCGYARRTYDGHSGTEVLRTGPRGHGGGAAGGAKPAVVTGRRIASALSRAAVKADEVLALDKMKKALKSDDTEVADELGW